jgi:hypothetical protein
MIQGTFQMPGFSISQIRLWQVYVLTFEFYCGSGAGEARVFGVILHKTAFSSGSFSLRAL